MYLGKIVELSTRDEIFENPRHPYTALLLASSPNPDPRARKPDLATIGEAPDPAQRPTGCAFHTRCPYAQRVCREEIPQMQAATFDGVEHLVACHFQAELKLSPVRDNWST
jgi:peptide/nickel transport system ATP-binding protein